MADIPQIERIVRIIEGLSAGNRLTIADLRERFDEQVSERTLQRDMQSLRSLLPIQCEWDAEERRNRYYFEKGSRTLIMPVLGTNEYLAAMMLKSNLQIFRQTTFQVEVDSLLKKLDALVPVEVFDSVVDPEGRLPFDTLMTGEYDYSNLVLEISELFQAIREKRVCEITYQALSADKPKTYQVTPVKMILNQGILYLVSYIAKYKSFLTHHLARIHQFKMTDQIDKQVPDFDVVTMREDRFGLVQSKRAEKVHLKFNPPASKVIYGRKWHPSQWMRMDNKGVLEMKMDVGINDELIRWIISWIPYVQVLRPDPLSERIRDKISNWQHDQP